MSPHRTREIDFARLIFRISEKAQSCSKPNGREIGGLHVRSRVRSNNGARRCPRSSPSRIRNDSVSSGLPFMSNVIRRFIVGLGESHLERTVNYPPLNARTRSRGLAIRCLRRPQVKRAERGEPSGLAVSLLE